MERNRLLMIAAVLAAVVVVAGGFLLGVQPQLKAASDAQATEQTVAAQNDKLSTTLNELRAKNKKLTQNEAALADLKKAVPAGVESGAVITELNSVAKASNVTLSNIQFGAPAAYVAPVSAVAPSTTATASSSASPSATASPSAVASTPAAPVATTDALITPANFTTIPVTVTIQGNYADALGFLQGIRDGDRLVMINSITSAASTDASSSTSTTSSANTTSTLQWTFGGLMYALTDAQSAQAEQATTTSGTTASAGTSGSSTDTAAGK